MTNHNGLQKQGTFLKIGRNRKKLEKDLRKQILSIEATPTENTEYGQMYEIRGKLLGPNGNGLAVCTIWMKESATQEIKFITMYPDKRR